MRPVADGLQPCPFCGSRDLEVQPDGRVHCRTCDAWGPAAKTPEGPGWGRRADAGAEADAPAIRGGSPETQVGLSLLLLGFTLVALVLLFTQIGELARWRYLGAARAAAILLLLSTLSGAAQLALAHLPDQLDRLPRRWRGLPFLLQAGLAAAAALPMALAFLLD
jgi:hypothetical protein